MDRIIVLELDIWTGSAVETQYFSTHTLNTGPLDTPANTTCHGLIKDAGAVSRSVSLLGNVSESRGSIVLNNANGDLDYLYDCGFGRAYRLKQLASKSDALATATVIASGIAIGLDSSSPFTEVRIRLRDGMEALKTPLLTERYAGTTTDGSIHTAEGTADLKDKLKPLLVTSRANITPVLVNAFHHVYQVSCRQVSSIVVRDGGVPLTLYQDFPTIEALIAATFPSAAGTQQYATCLAQACFRLDDDPEFAITADAEVGTAADRSAPRAAQRMMDILIEDGADIRYDEDSFDAMHALNPAEVQLWVDGETNADELITRALGWVGMALDPGAESVFRAFAIAAPTTDPERTFTPRDWSEGSFTIGANPEQEGGATPNYQIVIKYGGVQTTQAAGDLAGSDQITAAYRQMVSQQFQEYATPDNDATATAVLAAHPNSVPLIKETGIRYLADAQAEAIRLRSLFSARRDRHSLSLPENIGRRELGSVQGIRIARLGYDAGKSVIVLGRDDDSNRGRVTLQTFGPFD